MGKTPANKVVNKRRRNPILWALLALVGVVVVGWMALHFLLYGASDGIGGMKKYLENKYGQEFVVENYRVEGAGLGVEGDPVADAYPVNDENLSFRVVDTGEYKAGKHSYYDTYPDKLWSAKIEGRLNSMVNDVFGDGVGISQIELNSDISVGRDINGHIPGYEEAFSKYGKKIYLTIRLKGGSARSDISEKIFAFILSARELEVSLAIHYEDTQSALWMEDNAIQQVDTPNDILKYVKDR